MISIETETKLATLLQQTVRNTREFESARLELSELEFDPHYIFSAIDTKKKNYLTHYDLALFLE